MRIVIPTNDNNGLLSSMGAHFGKANFYTIVEVENNEVTNVEVVPNPGHGAGGCSNAITNILNLNPDALIVVGIGPNPAMGFNQVGLPLFVDKTSQKVEESINKLLNNQLPRVANQGTCGIKQA